MSRSILVPFIFAFVIVVGLWLGNLNGGKINSPTISKNNPTPVARSPVIPAPKGWKTDQGLGNLTLSAQCVSSSEPLVCQVRFDTHTVDTDSFDPATQFSVKQEGQGAVKPLKIEKEGDGHHREFAVTFPAINGPFTFRAENLAGVPWREISFP